MPDRTTVAPVVDGSAKNSTPVSRALPALKGSRWQLITASVMLALWIAFLVAMAIYSS
jgi:hypothetical protein